MRITERKIRIDVENSRAGFGADFCCKAKNRDV